jgi:N-acetylmuramoyl-L-alanine amidase
MNPSQNLRIIPKRILLDPGHSLINPGATKEYENNIYQATLLKSLLINNFHVEIIDPKIDDKFAIGSHAKGFDAFISLHLNAFDRRRNYSTCCISSKYNKPNYLNIKLASKAAMAIAQSIGINPFVGPVWPVGVMASNLLVLNAAHQAGCEIAFLVEPFFIDFYCNDSTIKNCIDKSMQSLANVLIKGVL